MFESNEDFGATPEWRPIQVLTYSAPSLTVNQIFIRPSAPLRGSRTSKRVLMGSYAPRRAGRRGASGGRGMLARHQHQAVGTCGAHGTW